MPLLRCIAVLALMATFVGEEAATALTLPSGFQQTTVYSGLDAPTAIQFASDGRVFIAEKSGIIKVFDSLTDTTPTIFADLRTATHNYWDRGLLGIALHPADGAILALVGGFHRAGGIVMAGTDCPNVAIVSPSGLSPPSSAASSVTTMCRAPLS